jgi:hypothetical protein
VGADLHGVLELGVVPRHLAVRVAGIEREHEPLAGRLQLARRAVERRQGDALDRRVVAVPGIGVRRRRAGVLGLELADVAGPTGHRDAEDAEADQAERGEPDHAHAAPSGRPGARSVRRTADDEEGRSAARTASRAAIANAGGTIG